MEKKEASIFLVNAENGIVLVRIKGRASYVNCQPLNTFLQQMLKEGRFQYCFFFEDCTGIDSTFLGILAGLALDVKNHEGICILTGLKPRQLETVCTLGLDHIVQVVDEERTQPTRWKKLETPMTCNGNKHKELILEAHRTLMEINEKNRVRFQDVLQFLTHT